MAVDDHGAVSESKEISDGRLLVGGVGLIFAHAGACVFGDASTFANGGRGVATGGVDSRRTDDQSHRGIEGSLN
jgi:hypothetical protein